MSSDKIIRRAMEITWRHKVLWIFGVVAAVFGASYAQGAGGGPRNWLQITGSSQDWDRLQRVVPFQLPSPAAWANIAAALAGIVTVLILVGLAALVIGTIARYTSDGALMAGVDEIERTGTTRFNSGLRAGWSRMLRLFAVDLLIGIGALFLVLPIVVILLLGLGLVIGPAIALGVGGSEGAVAAGVIWGVLTFIVWLVVTIAVCAAIGVALTLLREYALRFVVISKRGIFDSIGDAYRLATHNLRPSLLMWLFLWLISLGVGIVMIPIVLATLGATAAVFIAAYSLTRSAVVLGLMSIPALLVVGGASALWSGIYHTFFSAAWTLTFRQLHDQEPAVVQGTPA